MKNKLHRMTWKEVRDAFAADPVIVIPMGSMEVHGPHSIVGDYYAAEVIADRAAELTGAYTVPIAPFGCSEYFRDFPGTISVRPTTLINWLRDVTDCLFEHGITKILFLNGHAGNAYPVECLCREIRREKRILTGRLDIWQMIPADVKKEVYGDKINKVGHGGGPVDTVMKYLVPDEMRMDLIEEEELLQQWEQFPAKGLGKTEICGMPSFLPFNMADLSKQGSLGDPYIADAEGGKKIVDALVDVTASYIRLMQQSDMHLDKPQA